VLAIISLRFGYIGDRNLPIKLQLPFAERPPACVQLFHDIEYAVALPQPLIHIDECYLQHAIVAVHRQLAALGVREEFFSTHGK
jgi:hypothetical protein